MLQVCNIGLIYFTGAVYFMTKSKTASQALQRLSGITGLD